MPPKRRRGAASAPKRVQAANTTDNASNSRGSTAPAANNGSTTRQTRARGPALELVDDPEAILRRSKRRRVTPPPDPEPAPVPSPSPSPSPPPAEAAMSASASQTGGLSPRRRYARSPAPWQDEEADDTPQLGTDPEVSSSTSTRPGTKPGVMPPEIAQALQAKLPAPDPSISSSSSSSSTPSAATASSSPDTVQQRTIQLNILQRDALIGRVHSSHTITYKGQPTELKVVLHVRTCPAGFRTRLQYRASLFLKNEVLDDVYIGYINGFRLSKPSQHRPHVDQHAWVEEWWRGDVSDLPDSCNSMAKTLRVLYEKIGDDLAEPNSYLSEEHSRQLGDNGNEIVYIGNIHISADYANNGLASPALDQYYRLLLSKSFPAWYAFNGPVTFILMPGLTCNDEVVNYWRGRFPDIDYDTPEGESDMINAVTSNLISWYERHGYEIFMGRTIFEDGEGVVIVQAILGREMDLVEAEAGSDTSSSGSDDDLPRPPPQENTSPPMRNGVDRGSSSTSGRRLSGNTSGQRGCQAHTPTSPSPAEQPQSSSSQNTPPEEESELPEESFLDDTLFGDRALYGNDPPPREEEAEPAEAGAGADVDTDTEDNNEISPNSAIAQIAGTNIAEQEAIEASILSDRAQNAPEGSQTAHSEDDNNSEISSNTRLEGLSYEEALDLAMQRSMDDAARAQASAQAMEHDEDEEMSGIEAEAPDAEEEWPEQEPEPEARPEDSEGMEISTEDFMRRTKPWIAPNARRRE